MTNQNFISCSAAHAGRLAKTTGRHLILLEAKATASEIEAELGNVLDHDLDAIETLASAGRLAFFRTAIDDATTLFHDLVWNRTRIRPDSLLEVRVRLFLPTGTTHIWETPAREALAA